MKFKHFDVADVFGPDDIELAKAYIWKKVYYADSIEMFDCYIENKRHIDTLYSIDESLDHLRYVVGSRDYSTHFPFFLPLDKVKTEPVGIKVNYRYRPFRTIAEIDELLAKDNIRHYCYVGGDLYLRYKAKPNIIKHIVITNLEVDTNSNKLRFINGFTTKYLAKNFDIKIAGNWLPFGVEVKDE